MMRRCGATLFSLVLLVALGAACDSSTSPSADRNGDGIDGSDSGGSNDVSTPTDGGPTDVGDTRDSTRTPDDTGADDAEEGTDSEDAGGGIPDHPLDGVIAGSNWSYDSGSGVVVSGSNSDRLELELYTGTSSPCDVNPANYTAWKVTTSLPAKEGRYELRISGNQTRTVKFKRVPNTTVADDGVVEITNLDSNNVSGGMVAEKNADNRVEGTFEATRCDN